jgi:hypothetical protein
MNDRQKRIESLRAGNVRENAQRACSNLLGIGQMRRRDDLLERARVIHAALTTRRRFKALLDRSRELQAALERFKARRSANGS